MNGDDWGYEWRPGPRFQDITPYRLAIDHDVADLARAADIPKETLMTYPAVFGQAFSDLQNLINEQMKTPEQRFRELHLEAGDRIRLTEVTGPVMAGRRSKAIDAAVIEGIILGIKEKRGPQVRIKGFDHTGGEAGGQHVWLPVRDYQIEVLHKVYRLTDDDRLIAELAGLSVEEWRKLSDDKRVGIRQTYSARARRVKELLGITPN